MITIDTERYDAADPYQAYGKVTVNLPNGKTVEFTIHPSKIYSDTVNVEIDADLTSGASMRINLNDRLIIDTTVNDNRGPDELAETREPDLDDGRPIEDSNWWEVSYRIVGPDQSLLSTGTVEIMADNADDARWHAGMTDPAHDCVGTRNEIIIDTVRKL